MSNEEILSIFKNCQFQGKISPNTIFDKVLKNLPDDFKYEYQTGFTKLTILPDNSPIVIKIPFNSHYSHYDYDSKQYIYNKNQGANFLNNNLCNSWDYCNAETAIYEKAKLNNVEDLFCETKLIGKINNYPIYIQPKVEVCPETDDCLEEQQELEYYKNTLGLDIECGAWLTDLKYYYLEEDFDNRINFLLNNNISDLCWFNLGYTIDEGRPVILDYASSWESSFDN